MSFTRFISWVAEKLIELVLAAALLLVVKFALPQEGTSYGSPAAFLAGLRDAWAANSDEAAFLTHSFFGGQWWRYGLHVMAARYGW
ncbi:hypothetical protein [Asticcacaulis sp. EMRT-3]|uniref:hypothetical protein n=1 Tax=Asticcacaulis sp. EMRT-3 TaxID=3040349 RepID=UPI0024AF1316|nr:hypothetical protein [Asticcacaulis sp. EMRT-3]MDI7775114.1 hypothetical protein [Asticcacaulis sp. EMRT-3]